MRPKWPSAVWVIRHGQSTGNVARDAAEAAGLSEIEIATREIDVPLSEIGQQQAVALGRWIGRLPAAQKPTAVLSSPYLRAYATAQLIVQAAPIESASIIVDERLREKEFGLHNRLTKLGIKAKYPEHAAQRTLLGKFYYRPPGGESWCDVILRLRSFLDTLSREYAGERLLVISHQVVVNCLRYLFERLTEAEILEIDRAQEIPNCSITSYEYDVGAGGLGHLVLRLANFTAPLLEAGATITTKPNAADQSSS
jgi:broad specificity phosphatase PhoE